MNGEQLGMGVPRVVGDEELMREWFAFFGVTTGVRLLGWTTATAVRLIVAGRPPSEDGPEVLLRYGWGSRATRYRNVKHLHAFAEALREKGLVVDEDQLQADGARAVAAVVGTVS